MTKSHGELGQTITVSNVDSGKDLRATVVGPGWSVSASNPDHPISDDRIDPLRACAPALSACSSSSAAKPNKVELAKYRRPRRPARCGRRRTAAYLYEDLRAMRAGDIITILISENTRGSKSADTSAEKDSTMSNGLGGTGMGYLGLPGIRLGGRPSGIRHRRQRQNKFGRQGATNREDTLTGTISAIVTEVLPNGDLRIEGRRGSPVNQER